MNPYVSLDEAAVLVERTPAEIEDLLRKARVQVFTLTGPGLWFCRAHMPFLRKLVREASRLGQVGTRTAQGAASHGI
jgi:hypothetical protein